MSDYDTPTRNVRMFRVAVEHAEEKIGKAIFDFQPLVIRRALIAEEILTLINAQDEDAVSDARVRELALALQRILEEWAVVY